MKSARETPLLFRSQGQQVVGIMHRPAGRGPFPAVLFLHGFTGHKGEQHRLFVQMARALAAVGIASLRFDFRGSGDSAGEFSQMTVAGELADAREALRFLHRQKGVDRRRVGLLGMSMGGMVGAFLLEKERGLRTAVLWNPVGNPKRLRDQRYNPEMRNELAATGVVDLDGWAVGGPFIAELGKLKPLKAITRARYPLLIVQAERDEAVPLADAKSYMRALRRARRDATLHVIRGADHTFNSLRWTAETLAHTLAWFRCMLVGA